jgi:hypothetical protein
MPRRPRELPVTVKLPSFLLREIGRIITHHAVLEWSLSRLTYTLLGIDRVAGRIAVREPRTTDRLDMVHDLLKHRKISVSADLQTLREAIDKCRQQRDALAHGLWFKDPQHPNRLFLGRFSGQWSPPGMKGKRKRRIYPEAPEYSLEEARSLLALIDGTTEAIYDLEAEIESALKASPEKYP